jgi:hypothetical protein
MNKESDGEICFNKKWLDFASQKRLDSASTKNGWILLRQKMV